MQKKLLHRVESAAKEIGLNINAGKTEYMSFNTNHDNTLVALQGDTLKHVSDFQYRGSWVDDTARDMEIRIAKSWAASSKLTTIWKSELTRDQKLGFFQAAVESVLLYGAECWTLTQTLTRRLDGVYTRLLRAALNVSWRQHLTNSELYGTLPQVSQTLLHRRLRFSGHCWRSREETVHSAILWEPLHGHRTRGRPALTYIDTLERDSGIGRRELPGCMERRDLWRRVVANARVRSIR